MCAPVRCILSVHVCMRFHVSDFGRSYACMYTMPVVCHMQQWLQEATAPAAAAATKTTQQSNNQTTTNYNISHFTFCLSHNILVTHWNSLRSHLFSCELSRVFFRRLFTFEFSCGEFSLPANRHQSMIVSFSFNHLLIVIGFVRCCWWFFFGIRSLSQRIYFELRDLVRV